MDPLAARTVLVRELSIWRSKPYRDLAGLISQSKTVQVKEPDGKSYQIEIQVLWDSSPNGNIRVLGTIDDGGWRAFVPLSESFIVAPSGDFVGE